MCHVLLLLVSEDWIAEHWIEIPGLLQTVEWAEKHVFDLPEDFAVVGGSRRVGQIEWFFDAQRLPVVRIVFEASSAFAFFDRQDATSADGNRVLRVTLEPEVSKFKTIFN